MNRHSKWQVRTADPILTYILEKDLNISSTLAKLLINRGISTADQAEFFFNGGLGDMFDPFLMADMDKAVHRIGTAIGSQEKILVYGDYDADGITATALLVKTLRSLGAQVGYYIPDRMDQGYGLHIDVLSWAGQQDYNLVVTVDCGVTALEVIEQNKAQCGPDVIITDHHETLDDIPDAEAVLNPKRKDCNYPFKELAGVGVALKLAQALFIHFGKYKDSWISYLDLACLGTVADIVPLHSENRIIVKHGLPALFNTGNVGISALMDVSGLKSGVPDTREVGFALVPRINAAGRIGDPSQAVKLLLTEDSHEAAELSMLLHKNNQERQKIESLVLAEAMGMLDGDPDLANQQVIVLASANWHSGVVGIVASRLADRYFRPVLLIALEDGEGKGSGRSIPGLNLYKALGSCKKILTKFGGHAQAVGFSVSAENVDKLRYDINDYAQRNVSEDIYTPGIIFDAEVSLAEIDEILVDEIKHMAPFGHCNPDPVLACTEATLVSCREIGKNGGHLKMVVRDRETILDAIAFRMASCMDEIAASSEVDLAFFPSINLWQGRRNLQLEIKNIRPSGDGFASDLQQFCNYSYLRDIPGFSEAEGLLKKMGSLAFIPEWGVALLHSYKQCSHFFMLNESYLDSYRVKDLGIGSQNANMPHILDEQKIPCKWSYLKLLLNHEGSGSLILVNSAARAMETAIFLNHSGINAAYYHLGMDSQKTTSFKEWFEAGKGVLVSTYMAWDELGITPGKVFLFQPPHSAGAIQAFIANGIECVSLFGNNDLRSCLNSLEAVAPDREKLVHFYNIIRNQKKSINPRDLVDILRQRSRLAHADINTIAYGLAVFSDIDLIKYTIRGSGLEIEFNSVEGKKDLNDSLIFRTGQNVAGVIKKWWTGK